MKNTFLSMGKTFIYAIIAGGLMAGALAASDSTVNVTLAKGVVLGSETLAAGQYTITETPTASGVLFIFRNENGDAVFARAQRIESSDSQKTAVVLTQEDGALRLDKLFIEGDAAGYQFADLK